MFVNAALGSALRASGVVGIPTMIQSATVVINAILAPILVMGFLTGHPMGVAGAGLASSIAALFGMGAFVVTFNRAERFTISNDTDKVEVARVTGTVYEFDAANKAALQSVFDENGSTFFKFADTVGKVTVADVAHMGSGEQKGRFYKFNGTAEQFIVNADGNVVNVTRKHDVRFFDRPKS